nr:DNA translocase FtsK [Halobacillus litoralis]
MWKDLKNKMKRLLDQEEKEGSQETKDKKQLHKDESYEVNAKTKMTYRYPKQGEFRFPVIPDQPSQSNQETEEPESYQRRRPSRRKTSPVESKPEENRPERRKSTREKEEEVQELPETSPVPFTPTDVPSPIYGYQARQLTKGLEKLEYTVEEQTQPGFYTDSNEEKKWQDLRKKLRQKVSTDWNRKSGSNDAEIPKINELADEVIAEQKETKEEAAAVEQETFKAESSIEDNPNDAQIEPETLELPGNKHEAFHRDESIRDQSIEGEEAVESSMENDETDLLIPSDDQHKVITDSNQSYYGTAKSDEETLEEESPELNGQNNLDEIEELESHKVERTEMEEIEENYWSEDEENSSEKQSKEGSVEQSSEWMNSENESFDWEESSGGQSSEGEEAAESSMEKDEPELPTSFDDQDMRVTHSDQAYYDAAKSGKETLEEETLEVDGQNNQDETEEMESHPVEQTEVEEIEENKWSNDEENSIEATGEKESKEDTVNQSKVPDKTIEDDQQDSVSKNASSTLSKKEEKRSVPFNVLMTPRDKRSRDRKPKEALQTEEKNTKPKTEDLSKEAKPSHQSERQSESEREVYTRTEYQTPLHLLEDPVRPSSDDDSWITEQMDVLETTLRHFHVRAKVINAMKGPTVTRFEVQPEPGVKVSKITNLADDIKLSMAAKDIRIEAPIPGKQAVGIEVPNQQSMMVGLQEIFESEAFQSDSSPLSVGLGLDIGGDSIVTNLKKMPHGLIAGATGSGKSVCINTILISLLYKAHHDDVKFLLIDPKMVELAPYNDLPHLVSPVITDVKAATTALKWAVKEMEERYEKFVQEGVRDMERYNDKMIKQGRVSEKLPYLVIVIDELADLMMVSPQDVEDAICRIAQKARACGIHLLLATQRPSVDVITGLIKANIPTRIAFSVSSQVDSRTIIDSGGAEKLLGRGDMLFVENGSGQPVRIQGAFVSDDEIERVTNHVKKIAPPQYLFHQEELLKQISTEEETDELFDEAVEFVVAQNGASASLIQRRFKVGYNRAARLIDQMEDYGIISEQKGSKPRDILLTRQQIDEMMGQN